MTSYPQYPLPVHRVTTKGEYEKLPLVELMDIYDEFTALGLYLVPKRHNKKIPVWQFWEKTDDKLNNIVGSRNEALEWQRRSDVSGWCVVCGDLSQRLVVLDFDTTEIIKHGVDPVNLYEVIQSMSPNGFVLRSPANGVHIYYRLEDHQAMIGNNKPPVQGMDVRGKGGQVVTLGGFNRYDNTSTDNYADKKGVPDGHSDTYRKLDFGEYDTIPVMSDELYEWLTKTDKVVNSDEALAENYGLTEMGAKRIEAHFQQGLSEREELVIECLGYILSTWDETKNYEQWYQMWMAAHHGSSGSSKVRDYILTHTGIYWRDGETGRKHFKAAWDKHTQKDSGYTVSSLFWLAKRNGWLTETGYEIPDTLCEIINVPRVTDWLETVESIPSRLLLMSQTGTGKTYSMHKAWQMLGKPKMVVFVPSIKLATELASTLRLEHGMDATLYRDSETGYTRSVEDLTKAHVLVTTLQTFASKVNNPMSDYGLVIFEEADQLLQQFARGGGGLYGSHVSEREARNGFRVIREAMELSGTVWFVDATMTQITYTVAEATRGTKQIQVIRNLYRKDKPDVTFLSDKATAYQRALMALERGKKVVVVSDTAAVAQEITETMKLIGALDGKKSLLIIRSTERNPDVIRFMENVNEGAKEYDFVAYNSVMASGVSITSTQPDLIVQICTFLTPRTNLQMLNRYRSQSEVLCYYRKGESLYARRASVVLAETSERVTMESQMVNIPLVTRTSDAELRAHIASMSISDVEVQERSSREFYIALLQQDGRKVHYAESEPINAIIKHTMKGVSEIRKTMQEMVAASWQTIPPIDREHPAKSEYTMMEVVLGEVHAEIQKALRGNIPDDVEPTAIYNRVMDFKRYGFILSAFVKQEMALRRTEKFLADSGRAITTLMNNITTMKVLSQLHKLYDTLDDVITDDTLDERADAFVQALVENKQGYNSVINRKPQKFDEVYNRHDTNQKRAVDFAKILLARIGLTQRSQRLSRKEGVTRYSYSIVNIHEAREFLRWRNADDAEFNSNLTLSTEPIDGIINGRSDAYTTFTQMVEDKQAYVLQLLEETEFEMAVKIAGSEIEY